MTQPRPSGSLVPALHDIRGRPVPMSMPLERRNLLRRAALVRRLTNEFCEMPGLILSLRQTSRFLGVDPSACERILATLEREGLLRHGPGNTYRRA